LHSAVRAGLVEAAHDCSEGGLGVAVAEMAIGGRLGAEIDPSVIHDDIVTALFSESTGRIICEIRPDHVAQFITLINDSVSTPRAVVIGQVTDNASLRVGALKVESLNVGLLFDIPVHELVGAFNGTGR